MPISVKSKEKAIILLNLIGISINIISKSESLNEKTKSAFLSHKQYLTEVIKRGIKQDKLTQYQIRNIESETLAYWNESINYDTELFWEEVKSSNLDIERKNPIKQLLIKGRLRRVEQWIDLHYNIDKLSPFWKKNNYLTENEITKIRELLDQEEIKRVKLIRRCYNKNSIAISNYLKFGESIAFLEQCDLAIKHFSQVEREQILDMWKNTKYN